jgi:hypothetical protein
MTTALAVTFTFLSSTSAFLAQDSPHATDCLKAANTQTEMNTCASDDAHQADLELNAIYGKVMGEVAGDARAMAKVKAQKRPGSRFVTLTSRRHFRQKTSRPIMVRCSQWSSKNCGLNSRASKSAD